MAYSDRPYYRDRYGSTGNPLLWLATGSFPLFTAFDIRVRASSWMFLYSIVILLGGLGAGFTWQDRVQNVTMLFAVVLLHEFGHCFAARWVGGTANDIVMHPLGGLALADPPRRPLPTFITVAGGPFVNVLICLVCGAMLWSLTGWIPWNPILSHPIHGYRNWVDIERYAFWIYQISWTLLCFNVLPIYPLDGGQMLQAILWPRFGYYRSMLFSCVTGMVCSVIGGMIALATLNIMLAILAVLCFLYCRNLRRSLLASGPEEYSDSTDYSAAYEIDPRPEKSARAAAREEKRAFKQAQDERAEQRRIDAILAKVSAHGMNSLSWMEKRALKKATEHQRERDLSRASSRRGL